MLTVGTETGSVYELDMEGLRVRRVSFTEDSQPLRRDTEWIKLLMEPEPFIGKPLSMALQPLADDAAFTLRVTSPLTYIEES